MNARTRDHAELLSLIRFTDDEDELNNCTACICAPAEWEMPFTDNLLDVCSRCGRMVQFRPRVPKHLPKICMLCVQAEEIGTVDKTSV